MPRLITAQSALSYTPYFLVRVNATDRHTMDGTYTPVRFTTVDTNIGGHYSTTNYNFTAPVRGIYRFNFQVLIENVNPADDGMHAVFYKNGNTHTYGNLRSNGEAASTTGGAGYGNYLPAIGVTTAQLNQGDYMDVRLGAVANSSFTYHTGQWSEFSGGLIG